MPAHIHPGSCVNLTPQPKYPLENVKAGKFDDGRPRGDRRALRRRPRGEHPQVERRLEDLHGVRRYPLTERAGEGARLLGLVLLLAGCAIGAGKAATRTVDVTVKTATGEQLAFAPSYLSVPAGVRVNVTFTNASTFAHNLVFTTGIDVGTRSIVEPGQSERLAFASRAAREL